MSKGIGIGFVCCLCGRKTLGWGDKQQYGNNPRPLKDGECCEECNRRKVLPARLKQFKEQRDALHAKGEQ